MTEPLPIAVVGLNFGRLIAKELATGDAARHLRLAAVCDADPVRLAAVAEAHQVPGHRDLDAVLRDPAIPAIGLFTGPVGRAALIRRIMAAGKHVITTKPFETDPAAALAVLHEARAAGRVLHLNSPGPLPPPDLALVARWRSEFNLGRPVGCRGDVWANYREKADGSWYDDQAACPAAPVFRLGIYLINDLVRIFGPAEAVQVIGSRLFTGRPTADNAQLTIRYANGAIASLFASFAIKDGDHYRNGLTLNFENGTIYRNLGAERSVEGSEMALVQEVAGKRQVVARETVASASGSYQWEAFVRACRGGSRDGEIAPEDIVEGLRLVQAMAEAERSGTTVLVRR